MPMRHVAPAALAVALAFPAYPAGAALTGQTRDTRYPVTPKAHVLKAGYEEVALGPYGLASIWGVGERSELGFGVGGNATWYITGALPTGYSLYPGFSAGVYGKHLLLDAGSMGLAIGAVAGGSGLFSVEGPLTPVTVFLPFSIDLGPRNTLTVTPSGIAAWKQGLLYPGGRVSAAYEWRVREGASFLLQDDLSLIPVIDNRVTAGLRITLGYPGSEFSATYGLLRLAGPAQVLDYGLLEPELKWVGTELGRP